MEFRDERDGFACRLTANEDGELIYRRVVVGEVRTGESPADTTAYPGMYRLKAQKITQEERALIYSFCEEENCVDKFDWLLWRAEKRSLRHMKMLEENPGYAARHDGAYRPVTRDMLRRWLNPGLFDEMD